MPLTAINEVLVDRCRNWKRLVIGACAVFAVIGLVGLALRLCRNQSPRHRHSRREGAIAKVQRAGGKTSSWRI